MRITPNGRIAAIIPVFEARYLAEALESVVLQSTPPDEIIIVDDGCPDRRELERAVRPYRERITLLSQDNLGPAAARNRALAITSAEFVAFLDADDRWLPQFIERQRAAFVARPYLDVSYSDGQIIGTTALAGTTFMSRCPSKEPVTLEALLTQRCTVLLSAVVARRAAIEAVGAFDESLRRGQDFDLWLRMAKAGAVIAWMPEVLVLRRVHDSVLSDARLADLARPIRVLQKAMETMVLSPEERHAGTARLRMLTAELEQERGKELLRRGDLRAARGAFGEACRTLGSWKLRGTVVAMHVVPQLVRRVYLSRNFALGPTWPESDAVVCAPDVPMTVSQ